jgi:hypothetical protein
VAQPDWKLVTCPFELDGCPSALLFHYDCWAIYITWPVNITGSPFVPGEGSGAQSDFTYSIFHYMQGTLCCVLGPWHIIPHSASSIAVKREKIIKPQAISEEGWTGCLSWLGSATCKQSLNPLSPETSLRSVQVQFAK